MIIVEYWFIQKLKLFFLIQSNKNLIDDINCENNPDCDDISVPEDIQLSISTVKTNIEITEKYACF